MGIRFTMEDLKAKGIHVQNNVGIKLDIKSAKKVDDKVKKEIPPQTPYVHIAIKPLSVNNAWQGRRFKTEEYIKYEKKVLSALPEMALPKIPYSITFEFGFSNTASDFDNPTKLIVDILQKKYKFNDKEIYEAHIYKKIVPKGEEYFDFIIKHID